MELYLIILIYERHEAVLIFGEINRARWVPTDVESATEFCFESNSRGIIERCVDFFSSVSLDIGIPMSFLFFFRAT